MNRHLASLHRNTSSNRPVRRGGTAAVAITAFAAACVLGACGPDVDTIAATQLASTTPVSTLQAAPADRDPAIAATVAPAHIVKVADRYDGRYDQRYDGGYENRADNRYNNAQPRAVYGQVSAIEPITQTPKTSGAGAVVGGVLGAVVGNQVGSGSGRAAATVLGGVGGAVVGNKVEKHRAETVTGYRVHVQLDNGGSRSFDRTNLNGLDVGDRVRVDGGRLREV